MSRQRVEGIINFIEHTQVKVGEGVVYLFILLVLIIVYEVTARYIFNAPTIWAWDLSRQIFAAVIMLAGGYVLVNDGHVRVDIIVQRFSERTKVKIEILGFVFLLFVCVILIWQGTNSAFGSFQVREKMETNWAPPLYPVKMLIPLGFFLMLLQGLARFMRHLLFLVSSSGVKAGPPPR